MRIRQTLAIMTLTTLTLVPSIYAVEPASTTQSSVIIEQPAEVVTSTIVKDTKLRNAASPDGDIIDFLNKNVEVVAQERIDNWYKVEIDGNQGYIYGTQINTQDLESLPHTKTKAVEESVNKPENNLGNEIVSYARQFLGNPYVYGGNSLTNGVDCSGFTSQIYKKFGISLERSSRAQYASNGSKVSKQDILPGDLVFYGNNGYIDHVAIYAGNNQIVHANSAKTGIKMSKLEYGKPIIGIKRIVK